jgi:Domain of unknown function (DUF4326)
MLEIPGLDWELEKPPFPCPYIPNFVPKDLADEIEKYFVSKDTCHLPNPYNGKLSHTKGISYAALPTHSQCFGGYHDPNKPKSAEQIEEEEHCEGPILPSSEAPDCIRSLQKLLNGYLHTMPGYEHHTINYISVMHYENERAGIGWHNHNEDFGCDTPVLLISTGAERDFYLGEIPKNWKPKDPKRPEMFWRRPFEHGALLVLPDSFNYTHWHAILTNTTDNRNRYGVPNISYGHRISINTKCLRNPRVFSLKKNPATGKRDPHPRWSVYVGCKKAGFEASIYANDFKPELGHWHPIAHTEADFRVYAEKRMLDAAFRAQAIEDLRGKHLLCWCRQDVPGFCHARVWLEIVNRPEYATL